MILVKLMIKSLIVASNDVSTLKPTIFNIFKDVKIREAGKEVGYREVPASK